MTKRLFHTILPVVFLQTALSAQPVPVTDQNIVNAHSFIRPAVYNTLQHTSAMDSFYAKLYRLKTSGEGIVSIVHIGDSHIQADFLTGLVRTGLQQHFGNAGRGLVFPYQLARSNPPPDINCSSNTTWQFNRLAHPEIAINYGISGYGLRKDAGDAIIRFSLKPDGSGPQAFDRLKFFLQSDDSASWLLQTGANDTFRIHTGAGKETCNEIRLGEMTSQFLLAAGENAREFYGVSLENSSPGILYHTIGVNGARYDHYNEAPLFWKQLGALQADLFIISLGTNEAQGNRFNEAAFSQQVAALLQRLRQTTPGAAILITTAADSYKGRKPNMLLKQINFFLVDYCTTNAIPLWDLYGITNGYGSAYSWSKKGLMNRDRIHYTTEGYRIQGKLLLNALMKGYNSYISRY